MIKTAKKIAIFSSVLIFFACSQNNSNEVKKIKEEKENIDSIAAIQRSKGDSGSVDVKNKVKKDTIAR